MIQSRLKESVAESNNKMSYIRSILGPDFEESMPRWQKNSEQDQIDSLFFMEPKEQIQACLQKIQARMQESSKKKTLLKKQAVTLRRLGLKPNEIATIENYVRRFSSTHVYNVATMRRDYERISDMDDELSDDLEDIVNPVYGFKNMSKMREIKKKVAKSIAIK